MKRITIYANVEGTIEKAVNLRLKTGFGDPVVLCHKKNFSILTDGEKSAERMRAKRNRDRRAERAAVRNLIETGNDIRVLADGHVSASILKQWDKAREKLDVAVAGTK